MTIREISKRLNECANCRDHSKCEYYNIGDSLKVCTNRLINAMAEECRKADCEDDGK